MKEILITSTVLIAVLLLLRQILGKRVSRLLIYATWLLVAVRLLIPFQFGQLQFSIASVTEKLEQQSTLIQQVQEDFQKPVAGPDQEALYSQLVQDYLAQSNDAGTVDTIPPAVQTQLRQEAAAATAMTPEDLLTLLWISGAVLTAGWFIATNALFLRKAQRGSVRLDDCSSPVPVRVSACVATPCLAGLFRPRIYLTPECTADPQSLNHVLTHELTHLMHLDHIWAWIRCLCLCIYWFDPLVWVAAIVSKRDCELACDETALKKLGEGQRIAYGKTLLATVTHSPVRMFQTTTAMSESGKQLKERVNFIVKKPKTLLIAAVSLVLTATLTATLVFTGCAPHEPPLPPPTTQDQPEATEPTTTQPITEPNAPDTPFPDVLHIIPPVPINTPTEAQLIAQDTITRYLRYRITGICCDHELIAADLSQYLTEAQKKNYHMQQYKITCCHNAQQVRAHIDRCVGDAKQDRDPDDRLFTDSDGNLYITIVPMGYDGYRHFEVISQTDGEILARACRYDEDGCFRNEIFTLRATTQGYQVIGIEEDGDYRCEAVIVDQGPNHKVLRYGSYYDYEIYGDDGYLRVRQTTQFLCPIMTRISQDIWEVAVNDGTGIVQRTYWNMANLRSETYDSVIAVGYGKIAYLDGDLDKRVLVVCDIFDRSKADIQTYLGFAPEPMPVTSSLFTENPNGYGYELTLSYRIGKVTETTQRLNISP